MTRNRVTITGPDIDKLASGIHGAELEALRQRVADLTAAKAELKSENRQLRKKWRGALAHQETLMAQLAETKGKREKLAQENNRLRAQLLNHNITPLEES